MSAPISIMDPYEHNAFLTYIKHPVILEMFYSTEKHFKIIPDESNKFFLLDGSDFAKSDYVFPVVDVPEPTHTQKMLYEHKQLSIRILEVFKKLDDEKKQNFKEILDREFRWMYEVDYHNIPHLYNQSTGISMCGKENIRNIPLTELFPNEGYINKCKLCLRTKIGRILK